MPPRPPEPPGRPAGSSLVRSLPAVQRIVAEKIRVLRLLRALDRAGMDPSVQAAMRPPLVKLAEGDQLLTSLLDFIDREPSQAAPLLSDVEKLVPAIEAARGDVLDSLSPRDQAAVRRASSEVAATEAEIWLEVEGMRREEGVHVRRKGPKRARQDVQQEGERTLASGRPPRFAGAREVREHESKPLPDMQAPLDAWLRGLPPGWLRTMARLHDVAAPPAAPSHAEGDLANALAQRLGDRDWLMHYVAERIGASEREMLLTVVTFGEVPLERGRGALRDAMEVHWAWEAGIPATTGGRLRAAGFVYVGRRGAETLAVVPEAIRASLRDVIQAVDPALGAAPERFRRLQQAKAAQDTPHANPELNRWKDHEAGVLRSLERWATSEVPSREVLAAYFGTAAREEPCDAELGAFLEFCVLDWRDAPGAPTVAEQRLAEKPFKNAERQALARSMLAARKALCRVVSIEGVNVTFEPLFPAGVPAGERHVVADRALALTLDVGLVCGLRLYPAGPFTFCRLLGETVPPSAGLRTLRHLRRAHAAWSEKAGPLGEGAFLEASPTAIERALRAGAHDAP